MLVTARSRRARLTCTHPPSAQVHGEGAAPLADAGACLFDAIVNFTSGGCDLGLSREVCHAYMFGLLLLTPSEVRLNHRGGKCVWFKTGLKEIGPLPPKL